MKSFHAVAVTVCAIGRLPGFGFGAFLLGMEMIS
jgi:hypothetical protein